MQYLDFDLEIGLGSGRVYPMIARSAAGEARTFMSFPFDEIALENQLLKLQNALLRSGGPRHRKLTEEEQTVQQFGRALFEALLSSDVRRRYDQARAKAYQEEKGLRLRLHLLPPELAALPWEYLYDPEYGDYLCLSKQTPIVRYLDLPLSKEMLAVKLPLRILAMIASPSDQDPLDVGVERERLERALKRLKAQGLVELTWLEAQTWHDLQQALWRGPWHIFHFIGHGGFHERAEEGVLALANDEGLTHLLSATHLGRILRDHRSLRLVLLNACDGAKTGKRDRFSSVAAALAKAGIPAILAMQEQITDRAAIELTHTFYAALAEGFPVDAAVAEARLAINVGIHNSLEWGTPVLYLRSTDSLLFALTETTPQQRSTITGSMQVVQKFDARDIEQVLYYDPEETEQEQTTGPEEDGTLTLSASLDQGTTLLTYSNHFDHIHAVVWSPDGRKIASASQDRTVQVWDSSTGERALTYRGHNSYISGVAWSPRGQYIASASQDASAHVWNALTGDRIYRLEDHHNWVCAVAWSPDGSFLASGGWDYKARIWDSTNGSCIFIHERHQADVNALAWSPIHATYIASASDDKTVHVWDISSTNTGSIYRGHSAWVRTVAWSPDGLHIASGDADGAIHIWDAMTRKRFILYKGHSQGVSALAWSPDGTRIASASADSTVQIWDATTGNLLFTYNEHKSPVLAVAWSPDSARIASGGFDKKVRIWQAV